MSHFKHLFLRGVEETCVQSLYLMARGDITQSTWEDIKRYCKNYSRDNVKKGRGICSNSLKTGGAGV